MTLVELKKDKELLDKFIEMCASNEYGWIEIAKCLKAGETSVKRWGASLGLTYIRKSKSKNKPKITDEEFIALIKGGVSTKLLIEKYGASQVYEKKDRLGFMEEFRLLKELESEARKEGLSSVILNKILYIKDGKLFNKVWRSDKAIKNKESGFIKHHATGGQDRVMLSIFGKDYYRARIILVMANPELDIVDLSWESDHLNQNALDDEPSNLVAKTHKENCKNLPLNNRNTTGHVGVYLDNNGLTYNVRIQGSSYGTGYTKQEAYNKADSVYNNLEFTKNHGKTLEQIQEETNG